MMKSSGNNSMPGEQEEILDSEEDESLTTIAGQPDGELAASPTLAASTSTANTAKGNNAPASSALNANRKTLPASSAQGAVLREKIRQVESSIEHTKLQLSDTLDKLSANKQERQHSAFPAKSSSLATYPLSDLRPEQQQSFVLAQTILDRHIKQLGKYNQLKDIAMDMLGILAEREGKTMREIMEARGIEDD
ncbi:hypothetical protein DV738_g1087, partial [Chaetothyriales sp. CBS 135597]